MARTLHLVKSSRGPHPWDILQHVTGDAAVVLIQEAVGADAGLALPTFASATDAAQRGIQPPYPLLDDDALLTMIWEAETVLVW